jgi:hypothetical protein
MSGSVEQKVIRRLNAAGGIKIREGGPADLVISVKGGETAVRLEVKHRFTESIFAQFERLPRRQRDHTVLVVPELSPKRRKELRRRDISWVEYRTGTVHLRTPNLAIELPEERSKKTEENRLVPSLSGKAGIVVEALIELGRQQEYVAQPQVAELSGSTQAWTSKVFHALVDANALNVVGRGPAKEWRPDLEELMKIWAEDGGPSPLVSGAYVWTRTPADLMKCVAGIERDEMPYAIGGVAAANLHEPTLTSIPTLSVWVPFSHPPEEVAALIGGELVDSGANVLFWQATGDPALRLSGELARWRRDAPAKARHLSVVTPARAAVESLQEPGRGPEVGANLQRKILEQARSCHGQ